MAPQVTIKQGTLVGTVIDADIPKPIDAFLGVPYALPPTGDRRFRVAEPVVASTETIDATKFGPAAPGKQLLKPAPGKPPMVYSEDCLTANIFRQSGSSATKVPVMVYLHGGAFNRGTASMHNTASFVSYSEKPFIAVSFNYRIGALGFLPSGLSAKEGALNLGLKDQKLMFQWVQENIEAFGGDPDCVTLMGLSAGAHSIGHHIMNYTEGVKPLFHRAIIESGAPTSRAVRPPTAPVHEAQFSDFLKECGVPKTLSEEEIFPYLRNLPTEIVQEAQITVFSKYNPSLAWAFQPVVDGDVIPRPPLETFTKGLYHKVPVMTGFQHNEGSLYVKKAMAESSEFTGFFRDLLPLLSEEDIATIDRIYPDPAKISDSIYKETRPDMGAQYKRVEAAYGHYAYVAPVRQTAEFMSAGSDQPVYLYHWALVMTVNDGARHADNLRYETRDPAVTSLSPAQAEVAGTVHAYITSFITTGDPNAVPGEFGSRPEWKSYDKTGRQALIVGKDNEELIGGAIGVPASCEEDVWSRDQCEFWWSKVELSQQ